MKKFLLSLLVLVLSLNSFAQTSCPKVNKITYNATPDPDCFTFTLDIENTTGNEKSFQVTYSCGGTTETTTCQVTPKPDKNNNGKSTYTSPQICGDISTLVVTVTAFSNAICGGSACAAFQAKGGGGIVEIPTSILPVSFRSISATRNKSNVAVKWTTSTETDNKGFNVQRNISGAWEAVAFVFSAAMGGNSSSDLSYQFNDANNTKGVTQYRIQQVDIDGRSNLSEIRSVKGEAMAMNMLVYPNPSETGRVNVVFEDQARKNVQVSDMSGRAVRSFRNIANNVSIEGLESGVYSIQVTDLSSLAVTVEKVIIKKR